MVCMGASTTVDAFQWFVLYPSTHQHLRASPCFANKLPMAEAVNPLRRHKDDLSCAAGWDWGGLVQHPKR